MQNHFKSVDLSSYLDDTDTHINVKESGSTIESNIVDIDF